MAEAQRQAWEAKNAAAKQRADEVKRDRLAVWEERNAVAKKTWEEDVGDWDVLLHDDNPSGKHRLRSLVGKLTPTAPNDSQWLPTTPNSSQQLPTT